MPRPGRGATADRRRGLQSTARLVNAAIDSRGVKQPAELGDGLAMLQPVSKDAQSDRFDPAQLATAYPASVFAPSVWNGAPGATGAGVGVAVIDTGVDGCLLYTSPSPRDGLLSRMPSSA